MNGGVRSLYVLVWIVVALDEGGDGSAKMCQRSRNGGIASWGGARGGFKHNSQFQNADTPAEAPRILIVVHMLLLCSPDALGRCRAGLEVSDSLVQH